MGSYSKYELLAIGRKAIEEALGESGNVCSTEVVMKGKTKIPKP